MAPRKFSPYARYLIVTFDSTGQRYCRKKHPLQPRPSALAKRYLRKRGSLLSSDHSKESANELCPKVANWVADILDESLKAGKPLGIHQKCTLQMRGKQDATVASSSNTTSVENEGKAGHHVPAPGAPSLGTILGHCEKSGTTLMPDAAC
ncbi:unnamed protein product [Urochloa humidicola]